MAEESEHIIVPSVHSVTEAGQERTPILIAAMTRRLDEMAAGQVLEVVSLTASIHMDTLAWCHITGHELIALSAEGADSRIWMRKCVD